MQIINKTAAAVLPVILVLMFTLSACSSSAETNGTKGMANTDPDETKIEFYREENGKMVKYEAYYENKKLDRLFKDGKRLPTDSLENYEEIVAERIQDNDNFVFSPVHPGGMRHKTYAFSFPDSADFNIHIPDFEFDDSLFSFNSESLRKEMDKLKEELSKLRSDEFFSEEDRKALKESLKELQLNSDSLRFNIKIDKENLRKGLKEAQVYLRKMPKIHHFDFNEDDIKIKMEELKDDLKDLKLDMGRVNEELKKFGEFMKEFKKELKKDGLIKSEDEEIELNFRKDKIEVNGKEIPKDQQTKYFEMYKEHFGKEPGNTFGIYIN